MKALIKWVPALTLAILPGMVLAQGTPLVKAAHEGKYAQPLVSGPAQAATDNRNASNKDCQNSRDPKAKNFDPWCGYNRTDSTK